MVPLGSMLSNPCIAKALSRGQLRVAQAGWDSYRAMLESSQRSKPAALSMSSEATDLLQLMSEWDTRPSPFDHGDVGSQFTACAACLSAAGVAVTAASLRRQVAGWLSTRGGMQLNDCLLCDLVESWPHYLAGLQDGSRRGDHVTLRAIATMYSSRIFVFAATPSAAAYHVDPWPGAVVRREFMVATFRGTHFAHCVAGAASTPPPKKARH
jgi:hypothetical protein